MGPAERFLAYCALNVRWPHVGDGTADLSHRLQLGERDIRCDAVRERIKDMTKHQGNTYFCTTMPEAAAIFNIEKYYRDDMGWPFPVSHQRMCESWLKKNPHAEQSAEEFLKKGSSSS